MAAGTIVGVGDQGVTVACGEATYLVEIVQPEGKRPMPAAAWARGIGAVAKRRLGGDV
jgi:methionyl-tRNA formyltransferase